MLTADQIEALGNKAQQIISKVTDFLIEDIARRISEAGQLTSTAAYQTWRLQQLGVSQRQLKKELRKRLQVSDKELEQLLTQAAEVGYNFDIRNLPTEEAIPFSENSSIQQIVNSAVQLAQEDMSNITQTIGFVTPNGKAVGLTDAYKEACDYAFSKVVTGAQDYNSAIRDATKNLTEKGIVTIDYDSGVHTSLEAAVRRNIMGGLGLMQEQISRQNHDDLGCDGWEISAHSASAPDHEPIQGKQYSDAAFEKLNNSLVRRIGTLNCGHAAFPIIMGVSSPQYSDAELEEMRQDNEKGVDYEGRHYTKYEATQRQRQLERSIRKQKRRILAAEQNPNDKERLQQAQIKYQVLDQEYKRFSKAAGLRLQHERMEMAGFGPKQARAAERLTNNISKMANADENNNDWSEAIARTVTKEEKSALIAYAGDRGIKIPSLNYFDGDPDLLKAQIDALSTVSQQLPTGNKLVLSVSKSLPDEDFAETVGNHITVNNKALRNRKVTEANLAAGGVFSSSKAEAVVIHEYGHVITMAKGNKGVEIAQKACYNIFGKNLDIGDILKVLRREVSPYSTTYYAKRNSPFAFDSSRYKEIIPEILAKNSFGKNELTVEFVKILKEMF